MSARRSLVSPGFDFGWFVLPGIITALVAIAIGVLDGPHTSSGIGLWIVGVLLVDVAHVYASLYRTYFDPVARRHHRSRLIWAPLLCAWLGFLLHLESPRLFWMVLAYLAIFHFIKQHVGFAMLYVRAGGESGLDRRLTAAAVWAGTLVPVVFWHANLPTSFAWFVEGDLVGGLPRWVGHAALVAQVPVWLAFLGRRLSLWRQGRANPMVVGLALVPALNWHLGIVVFDDDRIFTITNVFLHGIPYLALVWMTGGRATVERALGRLRLARRTLPLIVAYYGLLVGLAFSEEALWDRLVWHDHPELFGAGTPGLEIESLAGAAIVAILTVPQATHYLLDRWIWRVGPQNPALAGQLGLPRPSSP